MTIVGQKRTIGDTVEFAGTITGVVLTGATVRFRAWAGSIAAPTWFVQKAATVDAGTGAWEAAILPDDWTGMPNQPTVVNVELEVLDTDGNVSTVVTGEQFRATPQAILPPTP